MTAPELRFEAEVARPTARSKIAAGLPSVNEGISEMPLFVTLTAPDKATSEIGPCDAAD